MRTKIAVCLLCVASLSACQTAPRVTHNDVRDAKGGNRYASTNRAGAEPAAPAEAPAYDIPAEGPNDPVRNPALVPTPLLRQAATAGP